MCFDHCLPAIQGKLRRSYACPAQIWGDHISNCRNSQCSRLTVSGNPMPLGAYSTNLCLTKTPYPLSLTAWRRFLKCVMMIYVIYFPSTQTQNPFAQSLYQNCLHLNKSKEIVFLLNKCIHLCKLINH